MYSIIQTCIQNRINPKASLKFLAEFGNYFFYLKTAEKKINPIDVNMGTGYRLAALRSIMEKAPDRKAGKVCDENGKS